MSEDQKDVSVQYISKRLDAYIAEAADPPAALLSVIAEGLHSIAGELISIRTLLAKRTTPEAVADVARTVKMVLGQTGVLTPDAAEDQARFEAAMDAAVAEASAHARAMREATLAEAEAGRKHFIPPLDGAEQMRERMREAELEQYQRQTDARRRKLNADGINCDYASDAVVNRVYEERFYDGKSKDNARNAIARERDRWSDQVTKGRPDPETVTKPDIVSNSLPMSSEAVKQVIDKARRSAVKAVAEEIGSCAPGPPAVNEARDPAVNRLDEKPPAADAPPQGEGMESLDEAVEEATKDG